MNQFEKMLNEESQNFQELREGQIVTGVISELNQRFMTIDFGFKSEGYIFFRDLPFSMRDNFSIGKEISVFIELVDNGFGQMVLSFEKAQEHNNLKNIEKSFKNDDFFIEVTAVNITSRGIVVDYNMTQCFLPFSLADQYKKENYDFLLNQKFFVKVVKFQVEKNNILVSRKSYLDQQESGSISERLESLTVGSTVKGRVKSFVKYGVFVDLGYMDSLIHINEISWMKVNDSRDYLTKDQEYDFKISSIDHDKKRVSLSYKDNDLTPWLEVVNNHSKDDVIDVEVVHIEENGIFVRYKDSIDFFIHRNEISWQKLFGDLENFVSIGDKVKAKIKEIKEEKRSLSLSIKESQDNPIPKFVKEHSVGDNVTCIIESVGNYDLFVTIDDVPAVIPKNELSWVNESKNVLDEYKVGQELNCLIKLLNNEKIILSLREMDEDPLNKYRRMLKGEKVKVLVTGVTKSKYQLKTSDGFKVLLDNSDFKNINWEDVFDADSEVNVTFKGLKGRTIIANMSFYGNQNEVPKSSAFDALKK